MEGDALATTSALGGSLGRWSGEGPAAPSVSQNPAEVLAALMDFSGSVALAELLAAPLPSGPSHPQATALGEQLVAGVRARLDALLPLALKPLSGRRAPNVPPPYELLALLREHAPTGRPDPEAAARVARELGAPLRSALGTSLRQAQAHVATLRWQIAHELRALGPRAERLERIDAALQRSVQAKIGELLDRMEYAAELTFERACVHACAALPDDFGLPDLEAWGADNGWFERFRERCVRMTKALFGHLRRAVEGLMRAAIHAEDV
jgi:hypothetical protein